MLEKGEREMKRMYINMQPTQLTQLYVLRTETGTKNGEIAVDQIANFLNSNHVEEVCLYGTKSYVEGIKKRIDRELTSKYNYKHCNIYIMEES